MINIGDKTEGDYLCLLNVPWPSVTGWGGDFCAGLFFEANSTASNTNVDTGPPENFVEYGS